MHGPLHPRSRQGVGLIELMVAISLVAIIAMVAIPRYLELRRKAMRAEVLPLLRSIGVAQQAWNSAHGTWLAALPNPAPPAGGLLRPFDERPDWQTLGWRPEGMVRCSYSATLLDQGRRVRVDGLCDLDGDRRVAILRHEVPSAGEPGSFEDLYPERY